MSKVDLEKLVRDRFGMDLKAFIRQKTEGEALYDYEVGAILNISGSLTGKLRKSFGIKKADAFSRRFERKYGKGSVEAFKKMAEDPEISLARVGRHFGFSREYARYVYKKIYGCPYTAAYKRKRIIKETRRIAERTKVCRKMANLKVVTDKMKSMGLMVRLLNNGRLHVLLTNGYRIALRAASKPVTVGKKHYFRFNNAKSVNKDFDFFICICKDHNEDTHFVIPSSAMPSSMVSLLPKAGPRRSKYSQYKEAWHLLDHQDSGAVSRTH